MSSHSRQLTARFKITTPMFLAGADQEEVLTSIRPPSVKGALRFWWRAVNWARVRAQYSTDKAALQQLHKEEGKLFGGAHIHGRDEQGQAVVRAEQSRVAIRVRKPEKDRPENGYIERATISPSSGLQYLLGMGLYSYKDGILRSPIQGAFTLELHLAPSLTNDQCRQVEEAVLCFGLLGALGSRARHGWGSVSIQSLEGGELPVPATVAEYKNCVRDLLAQCMTVSSEPPFSAFYRQSRIDISAIGTNAMELLRELGDEQQMYRSWGQNGKVAGKVAECNFTDDHEWAYSVARGEFPEMAPERAVFGLPHNYFLSGNKSKIDTQVTGNRRRAAPLVAHVHQFRDGSCLLVQTLLQSLFLPPGLKMEIKANRSTKEVAVDPQWQVIHKFMDRFPIRETLYGH